VYVHPPSKLPTEKIIDTVHEQNMTVPNATVAGLNVMFREQWVCRVKRSAVHLLRTSEWEMHTTSKPPQSGDVQLQTRDVEGIDTARQ
jgi:hypothetical protein